MGQKGVKADEVRRKNVYHANVSGNLCFPENQSQRMRRTKSKKAKNRLVKEAKEKECLWQNYVNSNFINDFLI